MKLRSLIFAIPLAAVTACGNSSSSGAGSAALVAATPAYSSLSFDQTVADRSEPTALPAAVAGAVATNAASTQMGMGGGEGCHPHLFMREREVVERVNRHVYKVLGKVEKMITTVEFSDTTKTHTWTKTEHGSDLSFTINWIAPNEYSWEFDAAVSGNPLDKVMDGYINRNGATADHDGQGAFNVDFTKLHAAFPREPAVAGTINVQFNVSQASRTITVVANDVVWELDWRHFDGGMVPPELTQPRSGAYVYHREPGKGGSLKIEDETVYACAMDPRVTNAAQVPATSQLVSRWYKTTDGSVHGRSDGLITGGQLTGTIVDRIVGVTCRSATPDASGDQHMPSEGFWLMKAEKADGSTVVGFSSITEGDGTAASPCDTGYGAVPDLTGPGNDFTAWPTSYSDNDPYKFVPGT